MKYNNTFWLLFSGSIKKILTKRYGKAYSINVMPNIKQQYRSLLNQFLDVGKNTLTKMAYLGIMFLSIWVGTDKKFSTSELTEICSNILKRFRLLFRIINLNKTWVKKKLGREINDYLKWLEEKGTAYPNKWEGYTDGKVNDKGSYYVFTKCPIRDFCEQNGYLEALPSLCVQDYLMYSMMHGVLKRDQTLVNDTCCDFWIYGNEE
jgi:hypothetical protein